MNRNYNRLCISIAVSFQLLFPAVPVQAVLLKGGIGAGEQSTGELFPEEDSDENFTYDFSYLTVEDELNSRVKYRASYRIKHRRYSLNSNLSSGSEEAKLKSYFLLRDTKEEKVKLDVDAGYRDKGFWEAKDKGYTNLNGGIHFAYEQKKLWELDWGVDSDHYHYARDSLDEKTISEFIRVKRNFREGRLRVLCFARRRDRNRREGTDREERVVRLRFDYKPTTPHSSSLRLQAENGDSNTKEIEERDIDFDYHYYRYRIRTAHPVSDRLQTSFVLEKENKDYPDYFYDHDAYLGENSWRYEWIDDSIRNIYFNLAAKYKKLTYFEREALDYRKYAVSGRGVYRRKKCWKCALSWEESHYDYPHSELRDRSVHGVIFSLQKEIRQQHLEMGLYLKYKLKDFQEKNDTALTEIRATIEYNF